MIEYILSLQQIVNRGLRKGGISPSNNQYFVELKNARPDIGILPIQPVSNPFPEVCGNTSMDNDGYWTFDGVQTWGITYSGSKHGTGNTDALYIVSPPSRLGIQNSSWKVTVTIASRTAGSIKIYLGSSYYTMNTNGTKTFYYFQSGTLADFRFVPTSDFDGTITYCSIKPGVEDTVPFPQMFIGAQYFLLPSMKLLYLVDASLNVIRQTAYNWDTGSSTTIITGADIWQFLDFGDAWFLTNGTNVVFKRGGDSKIYYKALGVNAVTKYKGMAIWGGFDSYSLDSTLSRFLSFVKDQAWFDVPAGASFVSNTLFWSQVGDTGFSFLFDTKSLLDHDDYTKTTLVDMLKRNEMGFMRMPWEGEILVVKQLGDNMVVYGDRGITILRRILDPYPSFGVVRTFHIGIVGRGAVAGDESRHVFLSNVGDLFQITADGRLDRLRYEEWVSNFGSDSILSYDHSDNRVFITSPSKGYVLRKGELYESTQLVKSVEYYDSSVVGTFDGTVNDALLCTDLIDNNLPGFKRLHSVEVDCSGSGKVEVALDYRMTKGGSFTRTSYKELINGSVYFGVAYLECRVVVKTDNYADMKIRDIRIRWNYIDKRYVRGQYANQAG